MSDEPTILEPEVRALALARISERLHETWKGRTAVDLDELALSIVNSIVDPLAHREFELREDMFMSALVASIDYAVTHQRSQDAEVGHLRGRIDRLEAANRELRDAGRNRRGPVRSSEGAVGGVL